MGEGRIIDALMGDIRGGVGGWWGRGGRREIPPMFHNTQIKFW